MTESSYNTIKTKRDDAKKYADSAKTANLRDKPVLFIVLPMILGPAVGFIVGAVAAVLIKKILITNRRVSDLSGDTVMRATENDTTINRSETSAHESEASLSIDEVTGQNGELEASGTKGSANNNGVGALNTEGKAVETEGGGLNASTQVLQT